MAVPLVWSESLESGHRLFLLVLAASVIAFTLVTFVVLVVFHTNKLYAPFEFRSDETFLDSIGWRKRDLEVAQILGEESVDDPEPPASDELDGVREDQRVHKANAGDTGDDSAAASGAYNRSRDSVRRQQLITEIELVEGLVSKYLKRVAGLVNARVETGASFKASGRYVRPDLLITSQMFRVFCEVKYTRKARSKVGFVTSAIEQIAYYLHSSEQVLDMPARGLIFLVTEDQVSDEEKASIADRSRVLLDSINMRIELVVMSRSDLEAEVASERLRPGNNEEFDRILDLFG